MTGAKNFAEALSTMRVLKLDAHIGAAEITDWQWAQLSRAVHFFLYSALSPLERLYADPHKVYLKPAQLAALPQRRQLVLWST